MGTNIDKDNGIFAFSCIDDPYVPGDGKGTKISLLPDKLVIFQKEYLIFIPNEVV